ncbi:MAG: hypothetical protein KC910_34815, partial [Candidatus Eremiobacteraeota bacterium]|nr:hypothetical protein [Candidatus Eremiobacteraeota bacterium]
QAASIMAGLPEEAQAGVQARIDQARASLADFQARLTSKDAGFYTSQQKAGSDAEQAVAEAGRQEKIVQQAATTRKVAIGAVAGAIAVAGLVLHSNSTRRRKEAQRALQDAQSEIADKTKALMDLLDKSDVDKLSNYSGEMGKLVAELSDNVGDALTLMGGADKVLAESAELIESKSMVNWFSPRNYDKALALLTNEDERVRFNLSDPSRAILDGSDEARSWKEELLKRGASREFEKSLYEILLAMAEKRDNANVLVDKLALLEALEKARASGQGDRFQACLDGIAQVRASIESGTADVAAAKKQELRDARTGVVTRMQSAWLRPAEIALKEAAGLLVSAEDRLRASDIHPAEERIEQAGDEVDKAGKTVSDAGQKLRDLHASQVQQERLEAARRAEEARQRAEEARRYRESHRNDDYYGGGYGGGGSSWGSSSGSSSSGSSSSGSSSSGSSWGSGSSGSSWGSGSGSSDSGSSGSSWGSGSGGSSWGGGSSGSSWGGG